MKFNSLFAQSVLLFGFVFGIAASSPIFALPLTQPGEDAAQIVGSPEYPANELYRVQFVAIDGRNIVGNREVLWIEPGRYTLTVRMFVRNPPGTQLRTRVRSAQWDTDYNKIEIVAEAGKTYHILGKYDTGREGAPYRTILYKVSDTEH